MSNPSDIQVENLVRDAQERVRAARTKRNAKKPKNTVDGLKQGFLSVVGGIATGAAGAIVAPLASTVGAPKGRKILGAAGGIAAGVGILIAAPIAGAVQGGAKVISGARAGGKARKANSDGGSSSGGHYHHVDYSDAGTDEDVALALAADRKAYMEERSLLYKGLVEEEMLGASSKVKIGGGVDGLPAPLDLSYYEALGLDADASAGAIKKAYRKLSLIHHPDRPNGDPDMFKLISEAYQVLSDPDKRLAYHKNGISETDEPLIAPEVLYSAMLLPPGFKPLIGDVVQAALLSMVTEPGEDAEAAAAGAVVAFNKDRVEELKTLLTLRIQPFVDGRVSEFTAFAEKEAALLAAEPLGADILHTIGYSYSGKARLFLAGGSPVPLKGFFQQLSDMTTQMKKELNVAMDLRSMTAADRSSEREADIDQAERSRTVTGLSAVFLQTQIDIQHVLREVVEVVCSEEGVEKAELHKRAQAIHALGSIFLSA